MKNLILKKIVVQQNCDEKIRKILKPGEYTLSSELYKDIFLEGVNVCAIVGKNGCGKSSLVEILFRIINNLSAVMLKDFERPAAEYILFVEGVVADLFYSLDDVEGVLKCTRKDVTLCHGVETFKWELSPNSFTHTIDGDQQKGENSYMAARNVAAHFFYLIATNYSMQSYVADDYRHEKGLLWSKVEDETTYSWKGDMFNCWIDGVFHKNDGYLSPIVLNPYRDEGNIDMRKEARLTRNRLCALLLHARNEDFQLVEGYRLSNVKYQFNQSYLLQKFDRELLRMIPDQSFSGKFLYVYNQSGSFAKSVLDGYGLTLDSKMTMVEITLRVYLVYKSFSVAKKYPQYSHYKRLGDIDNTFAVKQQKPDLDDAKKLAASLLGDGSHIALKIQQTMTLIKVIAGMEHKPRLENRMTYEEMNELLGINPVCETVQDQLAVLPPPLFAPSIFLIKESDYKVIHEMEVDEKTKKQMIAEREISMSRLSSGERQFIYTTSTLLYHSFNLLSIPSATRLAYRNICLVLEEVEICFHPEYQRTFVNKLLGLIERTKLNKHFGINIILVTHSPFVLSDVPRENILFLEEGVNVTDKKLLNTFGANVNELLAESFFLSGGFMGEFAKKKILSLVEYLQEDSYTDNNSWDKDSASLLIDMVGDEVIRLQLRSMYAAKFSNQGDMYRNWLIAECERNGLNLVK